MKSTDAAVAGSSRPMKSSDAVAGMPSARKTGFDSIEKIGGLVLLVMHRFWRGCSAALLLLFLLYWLYGGVVTLLLLIVALIGAFYHYQDGLLFIPDQPEHSRIFVQSANFLRLPFENLYLRTRDGVRLNAIFLKQSSPRLASAPTLIMLHGNAGNVGHRLVNAHMLYAHVGCNVFLVEYRGYGKSEGSPSERGMEQDAVAALEYLLSREDIDRERLIVHGRSLGGAVALKLAAVPACGRALFAVVLENTFTSIPGMAVRLVFILQYLPHWCYKNKFESIRLIPAVETATLFLSGSADQLVPKQMMSQLYQASGSLLKRFERFENGTHNETWQCPGYCEAINRFINEVAEAKKQGRLKPKSSFREVCVDSSTSNVHEI